MKHLVDLVRLTVNVMESIPFVMSLRSFLIFNLGKEEFP